MNYLAFAMQGDLWELNHKITVDPINKLFIIADNVTDFSIKVDLYSDYKEWFKLRTFSGQGSIAIRTIGGDPTIEGEFAGDIYFMINGWRVVTNPKKVNVTGVLFSDDYDTPWLDKLDLQPVYPVKVASIVTQIEFDLSQLPIPSATTIAQAVQSQLADEFSNIPTDVWNDIKALTVAKYLGLR